jgi:hypothetical protein
MLTNKLVEIENEIKLIKFVESLHKCDWQDVFEKELNRLEDLNVMGKSLWLLVLNHFTIKK